jgi:hypothetical protein
VSSVAEDEVEVQVVLEVNEEVVADDKEAAVAVAVAMAVDVDVV